MLMSMPNDPVSFKLLLSFQAPVVCYISDDEVGSFSRVMVADVIRTTILVTRQKSILVNQQYDHYRTGYLMPII
jgi:hypothetical protein